MVLIGGRCRLNQLFNQSGLNAQRVLLVALRWLWLVISRVFLFFFLFSTDV